MIEYRTYKQVSPDSAEVALENVAANLNDEVSRAAGAFDVDLTPRVIEAYDDETGGSRVVAQIGGGNTA